MLTEFDIQQLIFDEFQFEPTDDQSQLIESLGSFVYQLRKPEIFVMKGYAGTGKTSVVGALVRAMPKIRVRTVLMAPTGRAAKVLSKYSKHSAFTIHKKIYKTFTDPNGGTKTILQKNTYKNTLFIVDEASMVPDFNHSEEQMFGNRSLLEDLLDYVSQGINCKLILIGDTAQLPPVGWDDSPALDIEYLQTLCNCEIHTSELKQVVRQAEDSGILYNATLLRTKIALEDAELPLFDTHDYPDILRIEGNELEDYLNQAYSQVGRDDVCIICRSNKRANLFNQEIRNRVLFQETEISTGDLLMVLKNNYFWLPETTESDFIANGDMMEIMRIRKLEEMYGFKFADVTVRLIDYPNIEPIDVKILLDTIAIEQAALPYSKYRMLYDEVAKDYEDIPNKRKRTAAIKENPYINALQVKFAYALTCHKTQGGQWNTVFIDQGYFTDDMLNIEFLRWMYTAITRTTKQVYLLNFKEAFFE